MTDTLFSTILRRASYSSAGTLVARVAAALTGILIARAVGPGMFGVYVAIWAMMELSSALTDFGVLTAIKRDGAQHPERLPALLGNALLVKGGLGLLFYLGVAYALPLVTTHPMAYRLFIPLALASLANLFCEPFLAVLQIRGEQRIASSLVACRGTLFFLGALSLILLEGGILSLAWCQAAVYVLFSALAVVVVLSRVSIGLKLAWLPGQLHGALPFGISEILHAFYSRIPLLFLAHFASEEMVGHFAVALRFVSITVLLGNAANNEAFLPSLFALHKVDRPGFKRVCGSMQAFLFAGGVTAAAALYVCAEPLIILLQGEAYRASVDILRVLCWVAALSYASLAADAALTAGNHMRAKIAAQLGATITVLLLAMALTSRWGAMGAAVITLLGGGTVLSLMAPYAILKGLLPLDGLRRTLPASVMTLSAAIIAGHLFPNSASLPPMLFFAVLALVWFPRLKKG
jgi:O-antigen/teichoic acid export membrane protein